MIGLAQGMVAMETIIVIALARYTYVDMCAGAVVSPVPVVIHMHLNLIYYT